MLSSSVIRLVFACKIALLVGGLALAPAVTSAGKIYYGSDYSETINSGYGIRVCDKTSGYGDAYTRYAFNSSQTYRLDSLGYPNCNALNTNPRVWKHKVCQARPLGDNCSGYVYEF